MKRRVSLFLTAVTLCLPSFAQAQDLAGVDTLAPHTAQYELRLLETRVGDIGEVGGTMDLSLARTCDAWVSTSQLDMFGGDRENPTIQVDATSRHSEALDGQWMEFASKVDVDGAPAEAVEGRAELEADGRGKVRFTTPKDVSFLLPKGTMFPIAAALFSLEEIWGNEKKLVNYLLFDGDSPTPVRGTDIVAGTPIGTPAGLKGDVSLATGEARRVITTLFDLAETDSEPQATYIVDILRNGVSTRVTVDMGFMVVEALLSRVEPIPLPDC